MKEMKEKNTTFIFKIFITVIIQFYSSFSCVCNKIIILILLLIEKKNTYIIMPLSLLLLLVVFF